MEPTQTVRVICSLLLVGLMFSSLGMELIKHGEPRKGTHNAGIGFIVLIISTLVYWGAGLFSVFFK